MSKAKIIPVAKTLYLCDGSIGFPNQKTDLIGLFNTIRPIHYPHEQKEFVIFCQLVGGLGKVPFYIDIRFASTDELVYTSNVQLLHFSSRSQVVQMAYGIKKCRFAQPGLHLVELFCNGQWIADTTLDLV